MSRVRLSSPGAGLVEADVPGAADAEQLEVDAPGLADGRFVPGALLVHPIARNVASGDVDVLRPDVELGEQILVHEPMVGVEAPGIHRVVLVEVEGHDVGEAESLLPMEADQLTIRADRGGARREAEHGTLARRRLGPHDLGDAGRDAAAELVVVADDDGPDALEGGGMRFHRLLRSYERRQICHPERSEGDHTSMVPFTAFRVTAGSCPVRAYCGSTRTLVEVRPLRVTIFRCSSPVPVSYQYRSPVLASSSARSTAACSGLLLL